MERWKSALAGVVRDGQIFVILTIIGTFMTSACIDKRAYWNEHLMAFTFTAFLDILLGLYWGSVGYQSLHKFRQKQKKMVDVLVEKRGVILILVFCFLTRVVQFSDIPRWDGVSYYQALVSACQNFNFTFSQYFSEFALVGHPTIGYASLLAIGEFLMTGSYQGVLWINMILALLAAVCTYRIIEELLPYKKESYRVVGTCLVMSMPMVLGTFSYFSPDMGLVYFFPMLIYFYLFEKTYLMFFSILLLIQTKEVGSVLLVGFVAGLFLGKILKKQKAGFGRRVFQFIREPIGAGSLAAAVVMLVYIFARMKSGIGLWSFGSFVSEEMGTFTFIPSYIVYKLQQFFALNFAWLVWGGIFLLFYMGIIRKGIGKKDQKVQRPDIVSGIFGAAIAILLFYCMYITFTLPRYQVIFEFCGGLLFTLAVGRFWPEGKVKNGILTGISVMLFIQAYITVDPVTLALFPAYTTGNGKIVATNYLKSALQRDYCIYNHQFNYLDKAYDQILKDVGYHEGMDVIVWNKDTNGNLWEEGYFWDIQEQRRTLFAGENTIAIRGFAREDLEQNGILLAPNREAVFILVPQFNITEEYAENFLNEYYNIRYKGFVNVPFGGKISFYVCDLSGEKVLEQ